MPSTHKAPSLLLEAPKWVWGQICMRTNMQHITTNHRWNRLFVKWYLQVLNKVIPLRSISFKINCCFISKTLTSRCFTVQIFSGKLGVRNAGFRFRKTDWRGLVIEWRRILQKRQACHPNPPKSFPQAGEALSLGQKNVLQLQNERANLNIPRTRIQQQHIMAGSRNISLIRWYF